MKNKYIKSPICDFSICIQKGGAENILCRVSAQIICAPQLVREPRAVCNNARSSKRPIRAQLRAMPSQAPSRLLRLPLGVPSENRARCECTSRANNPKIKLELRHVAVTMREMTIFIQPSSKMSSHSTWFRPKSRIFIEQLVRKTACTIEPAGNQSPLRLR